MKKSYIMFSKLKRRATLSGSSSMLKKEEWDNQDGEEYTKFHDDLQENMWQTMLLAKDIATIVDRFDEKQLEFRQEQF